MKFLKSKAYVYIFAVIVAIILTLVLFLPAVPNLNSSFIGDGGDNYEYASYMMLFKKNFIENLNPFAHTDFWRYPVGFDFARSFDSHLSVIIGGTLFFFLSAPLAYNLTILILATLNGIFSFIYFRYLTRSTLIGLLGMLIYGFSFFVLAKSFSHLNLMFIGSIPLLAYSVLRIVREKEIKKYESFLFFFALSLLILGSKQYFLLALFFLLTYGVITYFFYPQVIKSILEKIKESYKLISISFVIFLVFIAIVFSSYIFAVFKGEIYTSGREIALFKSTPSIYDFFLPNKYLNLISGFIKNPSNISIESAVFVGWIELILFITFFLVRGIHKRFKFFILILFLIPFLLALGYGEQNSFPILPFRFIKDIFIFQIFAEPGRFFVIFYLVMTSAICLLLMPLKKYKNLFILLISFLIFLMLLERTPYKINMVSSLNDPYTQIVKTQNTKAVLDIPVNPYYPKYNVLSFYYEKPIVNGYFHWSSDGPKEKEYLESASLIENYMCDLNKNLLTKNNTNSLKELKNAGISTIVIHKDDKFYHTVCKDVRINLNNMIENVTQIEDTQAQNQINSDLTEGYPKFSLYFPKGGKFNLDGVYIAPDSKANFYIKLNGNSLPGDYSWNPIGDKFGMELTPKQSLEIDIDKGSTLTFYSDDFVNKTFYSIWYRFKNTSLDSIPYNAPIEYIYQSENVDILNIN